MQAHCFREVLNKLTAPMLQSILSSPLLRPELFQSCAERLRGSDPENGGICHAEVLVREAIRQLEGVVPGGLKRRRLRSKQPETWQVNRGRFEVSTGLKIKVSCHI